MLKKGDYSSYLSHGDSCAGNLYDDINFLPSLCCNSKEPECTFCTTCGGSHPFWIGSRINNYDYGPINAL